MRTSLILVIAVAACSNGGGRTDWTTKPLKPVNGTVGGFAFTIDLPDGLANGTPLRPKLEQKWHAAAAADNQWPVFTVEVPIGVAIAPPTLPQTVAANSLKGTTVVRQEAIADGFIVSTVRDDHTTVNIDLVKTFGETAIECTAMQANPDGLSELDAMRTWLEKVCQSLRRT